MHTKPLFAALLLLAACAPQQQKPAIEGTWKLISGTVIEKNDTTFTDYTAGKSFIKVINGSHFSFTGHDLNGGKDSATAFYGSGAGTYTLQDSNYTEHLEYCNDRRWEGNSFHFTLTIKGDTLIQQGTEKVAGTAIDRLNIEKYIRLK
ncbi:lipocalin-like domain-containing protein [Chitinophaga sedimenti]|uniref:lipocalin-like domain-containing protein n=1 Tax=Chitinophaga sedimenti TaxID=2033606 RepID=UPI002004D190|nr:lipocalin-like domain-containing protein [Chitinophaga sedimenti]MCK7555547.1 lipocalin-like domain-containing protein [Chitinophaga sedimenti]